VLHLGDVLDDGTVPHAPAALEEVRDTIQSAAPEADLLVVPGNHDGDQRRLLDIFDARTGLFEIGGYRFVVFADTYDGDDVCSRRQADLELLRDLGDSAGGPIVVCQHNPMNPWIDCPGYPFMLTNRDAVMAGYARAGVLLSLSGHYHSGQSLNVADGVQYFTCSALTKAPFSYAIVTLTGREVDVKTYQLMMNGNPPIVDSHAHTQFAYCATDTTVEAAIQRARAFGLAGQCFTEHAGQLYCSAEDFWAARHLRDPAIWREKADSRMGQFRETILPLRDEFVRVGLEVGLDVDDHLVLHDEDRQWVDFIVGAIHWLRNDAPGLTDTQFTERFMADTEAILRSGVDVLAHPWRLFHRSDRAMPRHLYADLASALAGTGTAVEINFHTQHPDPAFFAECIERGVKVSFASDAHALHEVGGFTPHLEVLRAAAGTEDVAKLIWYPDGFEGA
jgi:histidinol phosphatase-like PHP family hydrolase/predicted phosphodiesterase